MEKDGSKSGEAKTMKKYNKTYKLCIHHLAWCGLHPYNDCRKGKDMAKQTIACQSTTYAESNSGQPKSLLAQLAELCRVLAQF
jgi:hypothetical protein